jgi:plasmid stabilization system protein ParE
VIPLSAEAEAQLDGLLRHYERLGRPEAARNLLASLEMASTRIEWAAADGFPAPRPYPSLSKLGLQWIKEGVYWIAYSKTKPVVIAGVFYETADIPNRI